MNAATRRTACAHPRSLGLGRRTGRLALTALLLGVGLLPGVAPTPAHPPADPAPEAVASLRPEVRLRKLHLVRPDLIQYPMAYDVFC